MKLLRNYRFWLGIAFVALILTLRFSNLFGDISIADLHEKRHHFQEFVADHYLGAAAVFIGLYVLVVLLALPLPSLCTLMGGFLFGTIWGALFAVIGATIGALLFFLMIRHSLGISIQERYKKQLKTFNAEVKKYSASYVIAIRFIAFIPFFIQNILIGLTNISLVRYAWTTMVGILPACFVYAYAGQRLAEMNSITDVFSVPVLSAFILLALLGMVPILIQRYIK